MERLYAIAKARCGDTTQAAVAVRMNVKAQVVSNWESRGVSKEGAIEAERYYGASPLWILEGNEWLAAN